MKALEKMPARRYETANAMAVEVRRHLNHEPIQARPPSPGYRFRKMVRRNKLTFAASAIVLLALVVATIISTWSFFKGQKALEASVSAARKARAETERAETAEINAKQQAARSEQVAGLLKCMLTSAGPSVALGRDTTLLREILDRTSEQVGTELKGLPEVEADMREIIGGAYYDLRELDKAETMFRAVLTLRPRLGDTNSTVLNAMGELGSVLTTRAGADDLVEGESLLRQLVQARRDTVGNMHPDLAKALELLGLNYRGHRKINEMNAAFQEARNIRKQLQGTNSSNVMPILESPDRVEALAARAGNLWTEGKPAEAEATAREAIALRRKLYPQDSEVLAPMLSTLAISLSDQGKSEEAEVVIREAIALQRKFRGNEHPHLANFLLNTLAKILQDQGKWAEAEEIGRTLIPLQKKVSPHRIQARLDATHLLGIAHLKQQHWSEAEQVVRESIELCERPLESGELSSPTRCARLKRMLGEALLRQHKFEDAEKQLLTAYAVLREKPGRMERNDLERCLNQLAELCETTDRPADAAQWRQNLAEFTTGSKQPE